MGLGSDYNIAAASTAETDLHICHIHIVTFNTEVRGHDYVKLIGADLSRFSSDYYIFAILPVNVSILNTAEAVTDKQRVIRCLIRDLCHRKELMKIARE